jgi:nicotinamidase-related amidase
VNRALLVIDVQNDYVDGNLPIVYPPLSQSLPALAAAMVAAQAKDVPVIVIQTVLPAGSAVFAEGSPGAALHSSVASRPRDLLVTKMLPSCLAQTPLLPWLSARGVDTLTLTGYMTHNCVDATARHANHLGLRVEVLSDATGSLPYANRAGRASAEELHRVFLTALEARFATVLTCADWCDLLPATPSPLPTGIYPSNRNARAL